MKKELALFILIGLISISIVSAGQLKVTNNHPFYMNNSWIEASQLKVGDLLTTIDGKKAKITSIQDVEEKNPFLVYNLEDNIFHNYASEGIIVHNSNAGACDGCYAKCKADEANIRYCGGMNPGQIMKPGEILAYADKAVKIEGKIEADGRMSVRILKLLDKVMVRRSSGALEDGWRIEEIKPATRDLPARTVVRKLSDGTTKDNYPLSDLFKLNQGIKTYQTPAEIAGMPNIFQQVCNLPGSLIEKTWPEIEADLRLMVSRDKGLFKLVEKALKDQKNEAKLPEQQLKDLLNKDLAEIQSALEQREIIIKPIADEQIKKGDIYKKSGYPGAQTKYACESTNVAAIPETGEIFVARSAFDSHPSSLINVVVEGISSLFTRRYYNSNFNEKIPNVCGGRQESAVNILDYLLRIGGRFNYD